MAEQDWKSLLLSKLSEVFLILLSLVGIAIVIVADAKGIKYKELSLGFVDPLSRILLAVFGLFVLGLGIALLRIGLKSDAALPKAKDYDVKITHPEPNARIVKSDVRGSIKKGLPDGYSLWVFRLYNDGDFYPLRECLLNAAKDGWEARNCDVGGNPGDSRSFSVNIVGRDALALITYVRDARERFKPIRDELVAKTGNPNVPYMPPVTVGTRDIVPCASVKVERIN